MGLKRCLFGCLLALACAGTAAAMDATTQDPTSRHATIDSGSHDGGGSDTGSTGRDCVLPATGGDASDTDAGGDGGSAPHPHASHRSSLGWQSLLPGSIQ
ncbi:hypothetical protein [Fulvimonas yonginensis]|uniref:Secreted protein n=1 Tax=Fulvimonas yonginensis TaxID=1495200 RepID=A0ABU8JEX0_9GAMM